MVHVESSIYSKWVDEFKIGHQRQTLPSKVLNSDEMANGTQNTSTVNQDMLPSTSDNFPPRITICPLISTSCEKQRAEREEANWKCGFLRLSPELRNRIYLDTIPTSSRVSVVARVDKKEISVLQLCRAIRSETVPIFYGNTTFTFDLRTRPNFQRAKSWLHGLSPQAIASLRKIYVLSDVNCCCKEVNKNEKPASLHAWVDVEAGKWTQYGYHGCKRCSSQEGAGDVMRMIWQSVVNQDVRREDLAELLEIMRPIRAFDFSFEVAKDGEGKATFETRPKDFGAVIVKTKDARVVSGREIKKPRARRRPGMCMSNVMDALPSLDPPRQEASPKGSATLEKDEFLA